MFLKKTPKPKGIYLAITESYYDKEKKTTRQKTIMGLGYLDALKEKYPDPIAHFEQVVASCEMYSIPGVISAYISRIGICSPVRYFWKFFSICKNPVMAFSEIPNLLYRPASSSTCRTLCV